MLEKTAKLNSSSSIKCEKGEIEISHIEISVDLYRNTIILHSSSYFFKCQEVADQTNKTLKS